MSESQRGLFRSPRFILEARRPHEVRFVPRLGPSLAAALLDGLVEHPATVVFSHLLMTRERRRLVCGSVLGSWRESASCGCSQGHSVLELLAGFSIKLFC
jgi:hypothetical protein